MIPSVLIDNEKNARSNLRALLHTFCPDVQLIGEGTGVACGLELLAETQAQLVFLDVQMDDGTGMDLLAQIPDRHFEVIFTTAYDQFALQAIKLSALDYLLKPIDPEELQAAVAKAQVRISEKAQLDPSLQLEALRHNLRHTAEDQKLVLKDAEKLYLVQLDEIIRCEATGSYTQFFLQGDRKIVVSSNLRSYEKQLKPFGFYRSHHSHLFNFAHLDHYEKGSGGFLVMKDGSRVPVSVRRKEAVLGLLG
ncbi:MAG: LytTR family DNA-binding domain-containing protein [Bacteroidota bacterium]